MLADVSRGVVRRSSACGAPGIPAALAERFQRNKRAAPGVGSI